MTNFDPAETLLRARQRLANIAAEQPCRVPYVACTVCAAPVDGWPHCINCHRHRQSEHRSNLADVVAPLAYAWEGRSQLGKDVYSYKRGAEFSEPAANAFGNLAALLWSFSTFHSTCPGRQLGIPVSVRAVTPSLRGNSGTRLRQLAALLPDTWPTVRVDATGVYGDDGRNLDPAHFRIQTAGMIRGAHVLLLEDTWVTGAHSQAAAIALKLAEAAKVTVLPICRLLSPGWQPNRNYKNSTRRRPWNPDTCPITGEACP